MASVKKKDINLLVGIDRLENEKSKEQSSGKGVSKIVVALPALAAVVVSAAVYAAATVKVEQARNELDDITVQLEDVYNSEELAELPENEKTIVRLKKVTSALKYGRSFEEAQSKLVSYPPETLENINKAMGDNAWLVEGYASDGSLALTFNITDEKEIQNFADKLRETGSFETVQYYGFQKVADGDNEYARFTLLCKLKTDK